MKTKSIAIATIALSAFTSFAHAEWYGEAAYLSGKSTAFTARASTVTSEPTAVAGIFGYNHGENLSAEFWIGTGAGDFDVKVNGAAQNPAVTAKINNLYGPFVRARVKAAEDFGLFARFGYLQGHSISASSSASSSVTTGDWAYGVGASYNLTKLTYVTVGWMDLYRKGNTKIDGWSVSVGHNF